MIFLLDALAGHGAIIPISQQPETGLCVIRRKGLSDNSQLSKPHVSQAAQRTGRKQPIASFLNTDLQGK